MHDGTTVSPNVAAEGADESRARHERRSAASQPQRRRSQPRSAVSGAGRIRLDDPPQSLPVKQRTVRAEKLYDQPLPRSQRAKKYQRLKSLSQRSRNSAIFAALERREENDDLQREKLRGLRTKALREQSTLCIERRREQYLRIPYEPAAIVDYQTSATAQRQAVKNFSTQTICGAILAAFVLPLLVAVIADILPGHHAGTVAVVISSVPSQNQTTSSASADHTGFARLTVPAHAALTSPRHVNGKHPAAAPAAVAMHEAAAPKKPHAQTVALAPQGPAPALVPLQTAAPQPLLNRTPAPSVFTTVFGEGPATPLPVAPQTGPQTPLIIGAAGKIARRSPWVLSADGRWVTTLHAPRSMHHVQFRTSAGEVLQLEPSASMGQGAIVRLNKPQNVVVTMASPDRTIVEKIAAPDQATAAFAVTAYSIGPHLVTVGWTPLAAASDVTGYKVYRSSGEGDANELVAEVPAGQNSWRDTAVDAGSRYRYVVAADAADADLHASADTLTTPPELPATTVSALAGKGMFLYFSSLSGDPHNYRNYDPDTVINEAQKAGIRVIELRMARGTSFMAETQEARAWLDRLIDAASTAGIKLVAWTVPRRVTTEDLAQSVAAAEYTTPSGNGFIGLALDLETGPRYMGDGAVAKQDMVRYIDAVRSAVGPRYLLIATVASPMMGHLTNADYPYARIAAYADVMQPMEYWHYFDENAHHEYAHREVAGVAAATVLRTRALAGRDIPVNIAGQSVDLQGTGAPSGREISWSLDAAKSVGAIGETFFDWAGTRPDAWAAIQAFEW